MALAPLTFYVLLSGTVMLFIAFTFDTIILRQFFKKRTMGTILLFLSYLFFTIGEMSTISGNYVFTFLPTAEITGGYIQMFYSTFYGLGFIFFYFFANRHILQDTELVKSLTAVLISFIIGLATALSLAEIYFSDTTIFYNKVFLAGFVLPLGGDMPQYLPATLVGLALYLPILFFIQLRIVIKTFQIRRGLDNKISRAGFTYIFLSVLFLVLGTFASSFFLYDFVQSTPFLNGLFHSLRMIFNSLGFLFAYFGWVLPDWLKRRIRGKAWISKELSKKTHKFKIEPIATSKDPDPGTKIVEISEQ